MLNDTFAGFRRRDVAGMPLLWAPDERFKTFRVIVQGRRPLDDRAAARAVLPSLLLHGTERDVDRPAIARRMEQLYGAAVHPVTWKAGETHALRLVLDAVSGRFLPGHPPQVEDGLAFLGDLVARPRLVDGAFPAVLFERERRSAVDAARALIDDRGSYALHEALRRACEGEPMAIPEDGGVEALEALDAAAPEAARRDFLRHGAWTAVACGAFDDAALDPALARFVAEFGVREPAPLPPAVVVAPRPERRHVERVPLSQSRLVIVLRFPWSDDPDVWIGRRLFVGMFGGGPHSRLFREVREKRSLAYSASASAERHKGLLVVQIGLDESRVDEAEAEVRTQLAALQHGDFDAAELETARAQLLAALRSVDDSVASRCQFALEQFQLGIDRTPAELAAGYARADRDLVVRSAEGVWTDLVYLLAPDGSPRDAAEASA